MSNTVSFRPQSAYWRKSIRAAQTVEEAQGLALALVAELELHKAALRRHGVMPPKGCWAPGEEAAKRSAPAAVQAGKN